MGARGVVLIPGALGAPLDEDAQTWIDDLCAKYAHISFVHGGGLIAIVIGDAPSERLQHFIQLARTAANRRHIQHFFERLAQLHALEMDLGKTTKAAVTAEQNALNNRNWAMRLQGEKDELTEAYDARHEAAARFQAELFDRSEETTELRQQLEVSQHDAAQVQADTLSKEAALTAALDEQLTLTTELRQQLEISQHDAAQFRVDRFDEIAALTMAMERQSNEMAELRKKLEIRRKDAER